MTTARGSTIVSARCIGARLPQVTGMREFVAAHTRVVTTPGDVDLARRVLSPHLGAAMGAGPAARVETVTGRRRVCTDGARTVEIHDVGPGPHADEMPAAWVPAELEKLSQQRILPPT